MGLDGVSASFSRDTLHFWFGKKVRSDLIRIPKVPASKQLILSEFHATLLVFHFSEWGGDQSLTAPYGKPLQYQNLRHNAFYLPAIQTGK